MPRLARLDAPGTLHHVIVRGIEKRRIVDDRRDREALVSRMGEVATSTSTAISSKSFRVPAPEAIPRHRAVPSVSS